MSERFAPPPDEPEAGGAGSAGVIEETCPKSEPTPGHARGEAVPPGGCEASPLETGGGPLDPAPWGAAGAVAVPVVAYGAQAILGLALYGLGRLFLSVMDPGLITDHNERRDAILELTIAPLALVSSAFTLWLVYWSVTVMWRRPFFASLALRCPRPAAALTAALTGATVAALYVGAASVVPPREEQLGGPIVRLAESGPGGYAIWTALAVLVAPVVEEILFRGYAYLGARKALGPLGAGAAVSIAFTLLHLGEVGGYWPALLGILLLSALLALLMERTRNLTHCICCHLGYNAALAALGLLAQL